MSKVIINAQTGAVTRAVLTAEEQSALDADGTRLAARSSAEASRKARIRNLLTNLPGNAMLPDVIDKVNDIIKATRGQFYNEDGR